MNIATKKKKKKKRWIWELPDFVKRKLLNKQLTQNPANRPAIDTSWLSTSPSWILSTDQHIYIHSRPTLIQTPTQIQIWIRIWQNLLMPCPCISISRKHLPTTLSRISGYVWWPQQHANEIEQFLYLTYMCVVSILKNKKISCAIFPLPRRLNIFSFTNWQTMTWAHPADHIEYAIILK